MSTDTIIAIHFTHVTRSGKRIVNALAANINWTAAPDRNQYHQGTSTAGHVTEIAIAVLVYLFTILHSNNYFGDLSIANRYILIGLKV